MIEIDIRHNFNVPVDKAFAFITDTVNWHRYWPDFVRLEGGPETGWGTPGGKVTVVIRLLNRERALHIDLQAFERNTLVRYISRQQGLPELRHQRHFRATPVGSEFRLQVSYQPRRGLVGLFDRYVLRRSVEQAVRKSLYNLDTIFSAA